MIARRLPGQPDTLYPNDCSTFRNGAPMTRNRSRFCGCVLIALGLSVAPSALAQAPAQPQPQPQPSAPPSTGAPAGGGAGANDAVERARVHYERGLQLFNEENYDAALFEFERAYELAPSFKILYNMGRIQRQQNNYAAALRSYARYLKEGGNTIPADRRAEVEKEIGVLKPRTAEISVIVNIDGADVNTDDIPVCTATIESTCVGKSPLAAPVVVNPGRHKITAVKTGYASATSLISVVGSDKITVKLELVSLTQPKEYSNPWTVPMAVGWAATGAAAISAGVFSVLSLKAKDDQETKLTEFGATQSDLEDARDKTVTLSTVSNILWITTGVFAIASGYMTIKWLGARHPASEQPPTTPTAKANLSPKVNFTPFGAFGTF